MITFPLIVERNCYHGHDPKKLVEAEEYNRDAAKVEEYVNSQIRKGRRGFKYSLIARDLGMNRERIAKLLYSIDCGSNGFTIPDDIDIHS